MLTQGGKKTESSIAG